MKKATSPWARKAEADFRVSGEIARSAEPFHDSVCFHCQQSAEKYLKALLVELGIPFPRTHDLDRLLLALLPTHPQLRTLRRGLLFLTEFAVEARYPGLNTSKRQATSALRWAERVRQAVRSLLGLP